MSRGSRFGLLTLAWRYLAVQPLFSVLNVLMLSLGLALFSGGLLVTEQLDRALQRELQGIDVVVGPKGSLLQLILAGVVRLDEPRGAMSWQGLTAVRAHPAVADAWPVALGDTYQGFPLLGTELGFVASRQAKLARGQLWDGPMQAVLGADVAKRSGLRVGDRFESQHGWGEGGPVHPGQVFTVVGVLERQHADMDRRILTDVRSVWRLHAATNSSAASDGAVALSDGGAADTQGEISLVLARYRNPVDTALFTRWADTQLQLSAVSPGLEVARWQGMLRLGREWALSIAALLILCAVVAQFMVLQQSLHERGTDLAMMRMLGAPPWRVALLPLLEALILALAAVVLALCAGHGLIGWLSQSLPGSLRGLLTMTWFSPAEWILLPGLGAGCAVLSAWWPCWCAYRINGTGLLQMPR